MREQIPGMQMRFADIDECEVSGDFELCGANSTCVNTYGSYHCKCDVGFNTTDGTHTDCTGETKNNLITFGLLNLVQIDEKVIARSMRRIWLDP